MRPYLTTLLPGLELPVVPLGRWPTPARAARVRGRELLVKDEGRAGDLYGGNKVRKLELILADALRRGAGDLVTIGAVGSHHVLATATWGRALGLRTWAVLVPQPDHPHARLTAGLVLDACAGVFPAPRRALVPLAIARARRAAGPRAVAVAAGGSDLLGTLGWVSAGLELASDARAAGAAVWAPLGSGSTVAGLWLGLRLGGSRAPVVGVRVVDRVYAPEARARLLAHRARAWLGARVRLPPHRLDGLEVRHAWFGGGYGRADARVEGVIAAGAAAGLQLDPTYTGKALGALLDEPGPAVFVDTLAAAPPAGRSPAPLPPEVEALLVG